MSIQIFAQVLPNMITYIRLPQDGIHPVRRNACTPPRTRVRTPTCCIRRLSCSPHLTLNFQCAPGPGSSERTTDDAGHPCSSSSQPKPERLNLGPIPSDKSWFWVSGRYACRAGPGRPQRQRVSVPPDSPSHTGYQVSPSSVCVHTNRGLEPATRGKFKVARPPCFSDSVSRYQDVEVSIVTLYVLAISRGVVAVTESTRHRVSNTRSLYLYLVVSTVHRSTSTDEDFFLSIA